MSKNIFTGNVDDELGPQVIRVTPNNEPVNLISRAPPSGNSGQKPRPPPPSGRMPGPPPPPGNSGPQILPVTGYFVNVTKLMRAHGLDGIGAVGKNWYTKCSGASEAWHFDFRKNSGLTVGSTTFGMTLETMHNPSTHPPWQFASRTWRGGYFGK